MLNEERLTAARAIVNNKIKDLEPASIMLLMRAGLADIDTDIKNLLLDDAAGLEISQETQDRITAGITTLAVVYENYLNNK